MPAIGFDDFTKDYEFARPFLKMDNQGSDLQVFRGAGFALSGFFPVSSDDQLRAVELDAVMVRSE